jgi:multidrug efflux system membrane fusion protein
MRPVKAGQATVDRVQIASGLRAGERVITEGADRLREGSRVILPGDAPRGAASGAGGGASGAAGGASGGHWQGGRHRDGAASSEATTPPPARSTDAPGHAASSPGARASAPAEAPGPTAEQRQRMLDAVKDDPEQLERRKKFLDAIDKGDPQALERWRAIRQRQQGGGQ